MPFLDQIAKSDLLTGMALVTLGAAAVALFRWRQTLRAMFFLPLFYAVALAATRFRLGDDDPGFAAAVIGLVTLFAAWLLTNAFWSPHADDLAERKALFEDAR